eukprot:8429820-Pyramimonas_sp.AAC.1
MLRGLATLQLLAPRTRARCARSTARSGRNAQTPAARQVKSERSLTKWRACSGRSPRLGLASKRQVRRIGLLLPAPHIIASAASNQDAPRLPRCCVSSMPTPAQPQVVPPAAPVRALSRT